MSDIYYVETIFADRADQHTTLLQAAVDRAQEQNLEVSLDFRITGGAGYGFYYSTLLTASKR